ncbi:MAG: hypothetical protein L6V81_06015 [Clostridium sp.]|nr:MAG: hypothetical protein L6V81_06015 [Clostridium sp.]
MDNEVYNNPTSHLIDYLACQGVMMQEDPFIPKGSELKASDETDDSSQNNIDTTNEANNEVTNNIETPVQTEQVQPEMQAQIKQVQSEVQTQTSFTQEAPANVNVDTVQKCK